MTIISNLIVRSKGNHDLYAKKDMDSKQGIVTLTCKCVIVPYQFNDITAIGHAHSHNAQEVYHILVNIM